MCETRCDECEGTGHVRNTCSGCSGSGEGRYDGSRCMSCGGSGVDPKSECEECGGRGWYDCEEKIEQLQWELFEAKKKIKLVRPESFWLR
jgi:DnaJ-class molecular chaperone